jgi:hypothetical protein
MTSFPDWSSFLANFNLILDSTIVFGVLLEVFVFVMASFSRISRPESNLTPLIAMLTEARLNAATSSCNAGNLSSRSCIPLVFDLKEIIARATSKIPLSLLALEQ